MRISDWRSDVCSSDLTGMVDIVLPVAEMPQRLVEISQNLQVLLARKEPLSQLGEIEQADIPPGELERAQAHTQSKPNELARREGSEESRVGKQGVRTSRTPW